jgi:hypothetical protein
MRKMANAFIHAEISVKKHGGNTDDYYAIHDFCDSSKEVEASNRHRAYFHTMWGVKNVVVPLFGHTITNSDGKKVNVKDVCESDHILPDYGGKFIPALSDFIECVDDSDDDVRLIEEFHAINCEYLAKHEVVQQLLTSPLWNTGKIKSLLLTHNSWFIGEIVPRLFPNIRVPLRDVGISPSHLFNRMNFRDWMQNGHGQPPSFAKLAERQKTKVKLVLDSD